MEAIRTFYRGTRFRSKLEAQYAQTFDYYNIEWVYEVNGYHIENVKYLPDFWLPAIKTVLEVKGPLVPGVERAKKLAESVENPDWWNLQTLVLIGDEKGNIRQAANDGHIALAQCNACNSFWFLPWNLSYSCRNCGEYDGDHHVKKTHKPFPLRQFEIPMPTAKASEPHGSI